MGLDKRDTFDHTLESAFAAAGYSEETVMSELVPRAALLAFRIVEIAGTCPTMAIELLMGSPLLRESGLDNRDRAMVILLAGPVLASQIVRQAMDNPDGLHKACLSEHGFDHNSGKEQYEVLNMTREKWDSLVQYSENDILGQGNAKMSELVEKLEKILDDNALTELDKAILEGFMVKKAAKEAADLMTPSAGVVGPLAQVMQPYRAA